MHSYRVTKYDPLLRGVTGSYLRSEWTSHSDIGRTFEGHLLSHAEYESVELSYCKAAEAFLTEAGIKFLKAVGVENSQFNKEAPVEGTEIAVSTFTRLLKGLLREQFWCRLEGELSFVHVGWDYYMYVGVPRPCPVSERLAKSLGLFVENCASPYVMSGA